MSEKKTISINPDLFKINGGGNTTRKQKAKTEKTNKIQIKEKKPKKVSTIKRNILKMIRNQQMEKKKNKPITEERIYNNNNDIKKEFQTDFNETLEYLSNLTKDTEDKQKNQTIRTYPEIFDRNPITEPMPIFEIPTTNIEPILHLNRAPNAALLPPPKFCCLKNGTLPTYRNWINQK
jgi:hypothetical protein